MKLHSHLLVCSSLLLTIIAAGCDKSTTERPNTGGTAHHGLRLFDDSSSSMQEPRMKAGGGEQGRADKEQIDRKIIFTADIRLKVADFAKAEQALQQLVQIHKGYAAQAEVLGSAGDSRRGTWKIRVPVAQFNEFREAVAKLGELLGVTSDARDVTEEYFDLQSRIKNKEAELEAFRKIFDKSTGKIEEILAVQRELSRAQGELEQMKGRERLLANLTELTTVTIHMAEKDIYLPPPPVVFSTTIGETFFKSADMLVSVGKALVLAAVALAPWLPILVVIAAAVALAVRRRRLAARLQAAALPAEQK